MTHSFNNNDDKQNAFSHLNTEGEAHMVDISAKHTSVRTAIAKASVIMQLSTLQLIKANNIKKGEVLGCARIAGIMAAKKTAELIPMCHPIQIEGIALDMHLEANEQQGIIHVEAICKTTDKTGIEMEAITAVSIAAISIYDMCKSYDRQITISNIHLSHKSGGKNDMTHPSPKTR